MILITGATGRIGGATLKYLSRGGVALRALVRSPDKVASVAAPGVETVTGDLAEPRSLDAALEGVDAALLVSPLDPQQVALQGNFIEAAKRAGRVHVVKVSGLGTALDSPVRSGRWHAQIEQHLEDSGLPFTHLRPPFFIRGYAALLIRSRDGSTRERPLKLSCLLSLETLRCRSCRSRSSTQQATRQQAM